MRDHLYAAARDVYSDAHAARARSLHSHGDLACPGVLFVCKNATAAAYFGDSFARRLAYLQITRTTT